MKLIRIKADTNVGLTLGYTREPKSWLITLSFYYGTWMLAGGKFLDVMLDRMFEEEPDKVQQYKEGRYGEAHYFTSKLEQETNFAVTYTEAHKAVINRLKDI